MAAPKASHNIEGSARLFREIFQETSSGDFGIQIKDGPLFRCHSSILNSAGGFCGKVRQFGKMQQRFADHDEIIGPKEYFKAHGYTRLLEDLQSIRFSMPQHRGKLGAVGGSGLIEGLTKHREDPMKPGYSTAHFIGGTTCAVKRADPFFLAERYELDCDCELMAELLRFIYQGRMAFFDEQPQNDKETEVLTSKMLEICYAAERYSVDALYEQLLHWFGTRCFYVVGDINFADAFYHLQHYELRATEEHSRHILVKIISGTMLGKRDQFQAVTKDTRWCSLPVNFLEMVLNYDGMPITSETEVLNLIERWNATADKSKTDIIRLLRCYRPSPETMVALRNWLQLMGWIAHDGSVQEVPGLEGLKDIVNARQKKPPRCNLRGADLEQAHRNLAMEAASKESGKGDDEYDAAFLHYERGEIIAQGSSFSLGAGQRLLQADTLRHSGISRLRVALSEPKNLLWNPDHEVFIGTSYGEGKYFGYLCSATAFSGIFCVRALASAAPSPSAPVHVTGSGNKVEFDLALEIQLHRVDLAVTCKLSVVFKNEAVTQESFQISYDTLTNGPGLRYQVVATGLSKEQILVNTAWVSGGAGPSNDKEVDTGPIGFIDGVDYG
eukprot:TRINITY_DN29553_c1_g1_i1.p1 TRINITY_DN29553_c1_g1~~TRINITY_DN29553_c1_g1_i1.p1  ORF type:complete len:633 (+),score=94.47 TRINITY_DN29553_c1_g1_i1:66-1901(+)